MCSEYYESDSGAADTNRGDLTRGSCAAELARRDSETKRVASGEGRQRQIQSDVFEHGPRERDFVTAVCSFLGHAKSASYDSIESGEWRFLRTVHVRSSHKLTVSGNLERVKENHHGDNNVSLSAPRRGIALGSHLFGHHAFGSGHITGCFEFRGPGHLWVSHKWLPASIWRRRLRN